jgi:hypothetical protein
VSARAPSFEEFLVHAKAYGSECVVQTAASWLTERELARLRVEIDLLDPRSSRRGSRRRRRSTWQTQVACIALRAEGLAHGYIAEKLGISEKRVRALLAQDRRSRKTSAPPQGENHVLDCPPSPSEMAQPSHENARETSEATDCPQEPFQTHSEGSTEELREEPPAGDEAPG